MHVFTYCSFSVEEFNTIERIKMKQLFKILEMFVRCITDCLFDFCELPFSVKKPLPEGVAASVEEKVQYQTTKDLPGMSYAKLDYRSFQD